MGIRYQYDGYNLASLRRWATELAEQGYPIKGRSSMTGWVLLGECRAANVRRCRDAEQRFLSALGAARTTGKHIQEPCGCLIEATSEIQHAQDFDGYAPKFVLGRYIRFCADCEKTSSPLHVTNRNAAEQGYRFFLNRVRLVPRPVNEELAKAKVAQAFRPDPLDAQLDAAFGPLGGAA